MMINNDVLKRIKEYISEFNDINIDLLEDIEINAVFESKRVDHIKAFMVIKEIGSSLYLLQCCENGRTFHRYQENYEDAKDILENYMSLNVMTEQQLKTLIKRNVLVPNLKVE